MAAEAIGETKHPMVVWAKTFLRILEEEGVNPDHAMDFADDVVDLYLAKRSNSRYFFHWVQAENGVTYRGAKTLKGES